MRLLLQTKFLTLMCLLTMQLLWHTTVQDKGPFTLKDCSC